MSNIDYFKFENKDRDFPFYNKNPHVPKIGWVVLLFASIVGMLMQGVTEFFILDSILFLIIVLVPVLYYLKWDYSAIFQKPKSKEVLLAIGLFVGYMIYSLVMGSVLDYFALSGAPIVEQSYVDFESIVALFFSLMGEELIKFVPFMFFLRIFYKYSNNRKVSIVVSMLIVMVFFALLHALDVKSLLSVLVLQGLGSIFEFYGYIKTKNILISYITHLCTDVFIFALIMLGI